MTMIGAQLGDLEVLEAGLVTTNSGLGKAAEQANLTTQSLIDDVLARAGAAVKAIQGDMEFLQEQVQDSHTKATNANWTGGSQQNFINAYESFSQTMLSVQNATSETFVNFTKQVELLNSQMVEFRGLFNKGISDAQDSVSQMSTAVGQVHQDLDAVMNQSIRFN